MTLLLSTSNHFNNSLTRVKISFHETAKLNKSIFWARNLTTCWVHFRRWPKSNIISFWEPTTIMTLLIRTSTDLNKPLTRLKITFHEIAQEYFLSSKFDHVLSTFFVDDLYQILPLFQNLLGLWHSYLGPQPIWTSPWQDWKSLFTKLHKSIFWARNLTTCWVLFRRWPISNIIFFENLLRLWHSYLGPRPIWTSPWQDWKSLFTKLHKSIFWARNLTTC